MRTIIAGIDEAGFGPVLGPLVVSATVFEAPVELLETSMWEALAGTVCRKPSSKRRSLIAYADSKKLYSGLRGAAGLEHLERGVLAMLGAKAAMESESGMDVSPMCSTGVPPVSSSLKKENSIAHGQVADSSRRNGHATDPHSRDMSLETLLSAVSPGAAIHARTCPWYQGLDLPLPHCIDPAGLALDVNSLHVRLARAEIVPLAMRSEIVFESEFNRLVRATDNKSAMLFDVAARLLAEIWRMLPRQRNAHIFVDHQGGRVHYREALMRIFEDCQFKVNDETETRSSYTLFDADRALEVEFLVEAEDRHLPVALASMQSKYLRELFMTLYNRYWAGHVPDLAPTAGYYTDGRRFFSQIQPLVESMGLDVERLYRSR